MSDLSVAQSQSWFRREEDATTPFNAPSVKRLLISTSSRSSPRNFRIHALIYDNLIAVSRGVHESGLPIVQF